MFFLKDLPTIETLFKLTKRYPSLDPTALNTCAILLRTGSSLLTKLESFLGKHGLSQGRFLTLIVINRRPDTQINPSSLAEKVGVTRATMTGLLDGLERDGLIERVKHDGDRRKIGVKLKTEGINVLNNMLPEYYDKISKIMLNVTEEERETLISLLEKVNKEL